MESKGKKSSSGQQIQTINFPQFGIILYKLNIGLVATFVWNALNVIFCKHILHF